jgi:hypothetical protein
MQLMQLMQLMLPCISHHKLAKATECWTATGPRSQHKRASGRAALGDRARSGENFMLPSVTLTPYGTH